MVRGKTRMNRRQTLQQIVALSAAGVAGCTWLGPGDDGGPSQENDTQPSGGEGSSEGGNTDENIGQTSINETDWPMSRNDLRNTGVNDTVAPTEGEVKWSYPVQNTSLSDSPVVADGIVYIHSPQSNLHAISASNGSKLWEFETVDSCGGCGSIPTVFDGTVYFGDMDGVVHAVDATNGNEVWRFETEWPIQSAPAVTDNTVYIANAAPSGKDAEEGGVYAISREDGEQRWRTDPGRFKGGWITATLAFDDGRIFIGDETWRSLYGLAADDGSQLWQYKVNEEISSAAAVVGDTVYVADRADYVYAVSADDGSEEWVAEPRHPYPTKRMWGAPATTTDSVYFGSTSGIVYALSNDDGSERWSIDPTGSGQFIFSSVVVVDGTVYVAGVQGDIYGMSTEDGSEEWHIDLSSNINSSPAVSEGVLYVGANNGNLYAIE